MDSTPGLKSLPAELLSLILASLPLHRMIQLRCVCKEWNTLLHDFGFIEKCLRHKKIAPFYVRRADDDGYAAYNPESNSWHLWPFSFMLIKRPLFSWVGGAAGGLVLLESGSSERLLHFRNPINGSQKGVPLIREVEGPLTSSIVGMVWDRASESYKILAVNTGIPNDAYLYDYQGAETEWDDEDCCRFYVFDSKGDSWRKACTWERGLQQAFHPPVLHNGALRCLVTDAVLSQSELAGRLHNVVCFDGESCYELPARIPEGLWFAHLFEAEGQLMLAGGKASRRGLSSVLVWRLDEEGKNWEESMAMPDHLVEQLSLPLEAHLRSKFSCLASAGYLYVTSCSDVLKLCNTVMCDLSRDFWWKIPPYTQRSYASLRSGSFLFEPRFDLVL